MIFKHKMGRIQNRCNCSFEKEEFNHELVINKRDKEGLILLLWSSFKESLFCDQECFFWLLKQLGLVSTFNPVPDTLLFFQKLDQLTQDFTLYSVSLHHNKFKQQDLVPLQMWVLLIYLHHLKPHNLWEQNISLFYRIWLNDLFSCNKSM